MLSIKRLSSATGAAKYFAKDDYYAKDSIEAQEASQWSGAGAAALGLTGQVTHAQLSAVLSGALPNGVQLGRMVDGELKHAPGWDLTFSAPKSVSIAYEVGGDERVLAAHQQAVSVALDYLEKNGIETRLMVNGHVEPVATDNMIVARFEHDVSRDLDPQLHTHSLVVNATQLANGQWRSVETAKMYDMKMLLGVIYRAELASELERIGYQVEKTRADGLFEIVGVPQELMREFSQRRVAIEKGLEERGATDAVTAAQVAVMTRSSKGEHDHGDLREDWKQFAQERGFDARAFVETARAQPQLQASQAIDGDRQSPTIGSDRDVLAHKAVDYAVSKLSDNEAVFTKDKLLLEVLAYAPGKVDVTVANNVIDELAVNNDLVAATLHDPEKDRDIPAWTTGRALYLESAVIAIMKQGQGAVAALYAPNTIRAEVKRVAAEKDVKFTPGQYNSIVSILSSNDRVIGIQGYAGTGKTFTLNYVRQFAEAAGYQVKGLGPTVRSVRELESEAHIESRSIASFLLMNRAEINGQMPGQSGRRAKELWVIDETSMIGNRDMYELLRFAEKSGARVVLVGDVKQLAAVDQGKPFALLQNAGMAVTQKRDIIRQQTKALLGVVLAAIDGNVRKALGLLGDKVVQIPSVWNGVSWDSDARKQAIADHYLRLTPEERSNTLVVLPANEDRHDINPRIREGLSQQGVLTGHESTFSVLVRASLGSTEKTLASNYKAGMIVKFHRDYRKLGVFKGQYTTVTKVQGERVFLTSEQGQAITLVPAKLGREYSGVEVFTKASRAIRVGDQIRWTTNNKSLGIANSDVATVTKISGSDAVFKAKDGRHYSLDLSESVSHHWDYGYTATTYAVQGATSEAILMHAEDWRKNLNTQKNLYVGLSRAKWSMTIYVNDKENYMEEVEKRLGDKTSALESVKALRDAKSPLRSVWPAKEVPDIARYDSATPPRPLNVATLEVQSSSPVQAPPDNVPYGVSSRAAPIFSLPVERAPLGPANSQAWSIPDRAQYATSSHHPFKAAATSRDVSLSPHGSPKAREASDTATSNKPSPAAPQPNEAPRRPAEREKDFDIER